MRDVEGDDERRGRAARVVDELPATSAALAAGEITPAAVAVTSTAHALAYAAFIAVRTLPDGSAQTSLRPVFCASL